MFRKWLGAEKSEIGREIENQMNKGGLVQDHIVNQMVLNHIQEA